MGILVYEERLILTLYWLFSVLASVLCAVYFHALVLSVSVVLNIYMIPAELLSKVSPVLCCKRGVI